MASPINPTFFRPQNVKKFLAGKPASNVLDFFVEGETSSLKKSWFLTVYLIQIIIFSCLFLSTILSPGVLSTPDAFLISTLVMVLSFASAGPVAGIVSIILFLIALVFLYTPLSLDDLASPNNLRLLLFLLEGIIFGTVFYIKERRITQKQTILSQEMKLRSEIQVMAEQWAFFDEVNQSMAKVVGFEERLEKLANMTIPSLCDWCIISILDGDNLDKTVIAHANPEKLIWAQSLQKKYPPTLKDTSYGLGRVIKTGRSEIRPFVDQALINKLIKNPVQRKILKELNIKSTIIVPLISRGQTIGAMTLISTQSSRHYTPSDLKFVEHFAVRAAVSIDNAKLYYDATTRLEERRKADENLQRSQRQLEAIFENVDEGITVQDATGKIILASRAAARLLGFKTTKELLATPVEEFLNKFTPFSDRDVPLKLSDLPSRLVLEGKSAPEKTIRIVVNETGDEHWTQVRSSAVYNSGGKIQFVINLFRDITEQKVADQKKDDFIAIVSHELKTPLTSVRGFSELALKRARTLEDPSLTDYLTTIVAQSDRSFRLIKDLLDVARLRIGRLLLEKEVINVDRLITDIVKGFQSIDEKHPFILKGSFKGRVYGDKARLAQVFSNLISNSIRYSLPGKKVVIEGHHTGSYITIIVQDFGKGITVSDQKRIFNRYYQGGRGNSQKGLGLGLFITREIIKRHQGKIWVESEKNRGSRFFVRLPLVKK